LLLLSVSVSLRQQGDGREEDPPHLTAASPPEESVAAAAVPSLVGQSAARGASSVAAAADTHRHIFLPDTGIRLAKLPPIADKVDLPPRLPAAPLLRETPPRIYPRGSYPPAVAAAKKTAAKEPKFVPYEPYKGAVKAFTASAANNKKFSSSSASNPAAAAASSSALAAAATEPTNRSKGEEEEEEEGESSRANKELEQNYRTMLAIKEGEIDRLRQSLQAAEKQLKIQTQVPYNTVSPMWRILYIQCGSRGGVRLIDCARAFRQRQCCVSGSGTG
jgi:hypothetical protein